MARARNIKPGFFKNEDLAECSPWARLCFAGLWTLADRDGRLEDRPKRIKGELFAFDSVEVEPMLRELQQFGFLVRYQNEDGNFIQISKFADHQTPHYSEKPSVIKPPSLQESAPLDAPATPGTLQEDSKNPQGIKGGSQPPDSLIPDSPNPEEETVVAVGGSKGEDPKPPAPAPSDPPPAAAGKPAAPTKPRKNGQRLPEDWQLPKAWGDWALAEFPHWTADKVRTEAAKFRDHWTAKPGADATKLDWLATWRNWCRSDIAQRDAPRPPNGHAAPTATTPTPQGAVFVPPPPLSPEERARADVARQEAMAKLRTRRPAAS